MFKYIGVVVGFFFYVSGEVGFVVGVVFVVLVDFGFVGFE